MTTGSHIITSASYRDPMNKTDDYIAKLAESSIMKAYSSYLQTAYLTLKKDRLYDVSDNQFILNYDEFKEYYILDLVGKGSYVDDKVRELQFSLN